MQPPTTWEPTCALLELMVKRRNPQKLTELTRALILDNFKSSRVFPIKCIMISRKSYSDCCLRILSEKIDELEFPRSEKTEIKKLLNYDLNRFLAIEYDENIMNMK